jgi:hypothetical protein
VQVLIIIISYYGTFPKNTMKLVKEDRNESKGLFRSLIMWVSTVFFCQADAGRGTKWPLGKPIPNVYNRRVPMIRMVYGPDLSQSDISVFSSVPLSLVLCTSRHGISSFLHPSKAFCGKPPLSYVRR